MTIHVPVMLTETLDLLVTDPAGIYVDGTLGTGGHLRALIERLAPESRIIGIDADPQAVAFCRQAFEQQTNLLLIHNNFAELRKILFRNRISNIDGLLLDLGMSSFALDNSERGFAFSTDGPLDMRFSPDSTEKASDLLNNASLETLRDIFYRFGEERHSTAIARAIVQTRSTIPLTRTLQLAEVIRGAVATPFPNKTLSRIFQALRMAVNHETDRLESVLQQAVEVLKPKARIVILTYHSIEDRIVKQFFTSESSNCICPPDLPVCGCDHRARLHILNRRPLIPSDAEIQANSRARSAKLRAAERI